VSHPPIARWPRSFTDALAGWILVFGELAAIVIQKTESS
jgi:hypothetical protein